MTTKKPQFMAIALAVGAMFSAPVAAITDLEVAIDGYTEEQQALKEVIEEIEEIEAMEYSGESL